MAQTLGLTVKKSENIAEWYTQVIQKAELVDYTKVSGCLVFRPYAFRIWELIQQRIDALIKQRGVQNAAFPLLIPESLLTKESTHVAGFAPEVAWVTHGGNSPLAERLAVRPTSETIMYDSYSKWIRSYRDLPLKINQWCSVVRWEFKHPVPFLRTREFHWQEGHTVFATKKEADEEAMDILQNVYRNVLAEEFAIPTLIGKKSESERFAGADYSLSAEAFLPNGKAIQGCTSHHLGQNFSKAFGISFMDQNENTQFGFQNSWGFSTRTIGILILMHGDDSGLVLPPKVAPHQVVIVPIIFKDSKDVVMAAVEEVSKQLSALRVHIDNRDEHSPGRKFNEWELKGVPLRIEIGPKDVEKHQVMIVARDTKEKFPTRMQDISKEVSHQLELLQRRLYLKAESHLKASITSVLSWDEVLLAIEAKKLVHMQWCHTADCEAAIKDKTNGAKTLVIPFNSKPVGKCIHCGKESTCEVYIAKSY